jgi:hypothetical protein
MKICRPSTGHCDPAENCTGTSLSCPTDVVSQDSWIMKCRTSYNYCGPDSTTSSDFLALTGITGLTSYRWGCESIGVASGVNHIFTLDYPACLGWCIRKTCPYTFDGRVNNVNNWASGHCVAASVGGSGVFAMDEKVEFSSGYVVTSHLSWNKCCVRASLANSAPISQGLCV